MPNRDLEHGTTTRPIRSRLGAAWRRSGIALRTITAALLVIVVGAATVAASATGAARSAPRARRLPLVERNPVVLDSWGIAESAIGMLELVASHHRAAE